MTTVVVVVVVVVVAVVIGISGGIGPASTVGSAAAQIVDEDPPEESPGLGNIVGSPDAGPDPEDPGDRGGWAQLGLAVLVFGGVVFIVSRIAAGVGSREGT